MDQKGTQIKKMPLKKKSQITNKNFEKYNASFLQV